MKKLLLITILLVCGLVSINAQTEKSLYSIVKTLHLPGNGGWDYLSIDESTGRLFLSHGTVVQVVDTKTGELVGTIPNTPGVHGIAFAPELNKGFISVGRDTSVTVFNLKTLEFIARVKVTGNNPDAIMFDPYSQKVFTFNGRGSNSTVIDAKTNQVVGTIALDGKPEFPVSDLNGKIYVNIEDKSLISVLNVNTLEVERSWPIAPGEEPSGLAFDNVTNRLFSVCGNKMIMIVDSQTGKIITSLPIGDGCDGVKFDPELKRIYTSNGEGTMTIIQEEDANTFKVLENLPTQGGARTLAVDLKTHHIFLPTAEYLPAPEATKENPRPRRPIKPETFVVLEVVSIK
ncbi:MAG: YncE family protein [Bacteroidales bacterium]|nr:YncE family protein [Bacteroidales bacterium]